MVGPCPSRTVIRRPRGGHTDTGIGNGRERRRAGRDVKVAGGVFVLAERSEKRETSSEKSESRSRKSAEDLGSGAMARNFADRLIGAIEKKGSPICVGIDPIVGSMPDPVFRGGRERAEGGDAQ